MGNGWDLRRGLADHQAAVREFIARASGVPEERWLLPRAEGKWTPAQETRHLVLTYDALMRDLRRAEPMQLRGNRMRRFFWKLIGLSWIRWLRRIPRAVRAPREVRPEWEPAPASELLPALLRRAQEFEEVFEEKWSSEPRRRVTHPFGPITLDDTIRLSTVHTRHHAAFLPPSP
ncbi:MAG: DinB family protein [Gemmatimonadaceae bacterium]